MKKQLFSLMMAFALVLGLSVGAWAQSTPLPTNPVLGSFGNPKVYITGATDSLQITRGVAGSTVEWALFKGSDNTTPATATDIVTTLWDVTQTNTGAQPARFRFKWTDEAAGAYYLQVTETDQRTQVSPAQDRECAVTVRGFHIFIMGFDVAIYASNAAGDSLNPDLLSNCGGPTYPAFLNDVVMNVDGTIRTDILNTTENPAINGTDLTPIVGTVALVDRATRYYTAVLHFDAPPVGSTFDPLIVGSVAMNIKINVPTINDEDSLYVHSINGTDVEGDIASVANSAVNLVLSSTYRYTFPVLFNDSWGADLEPTATVTDVVLWSEANAAGINLGEEPATYEDTVPDKAERRDNTSNAFTIFGKPATGPISVH